MPASAPCAENLPVDWHNNVVSLPHIGSTVEKGLLLGNRQVTEGSHFLFLADV